jgi:hypothetical protein
MSFNVQTYRPPGPVAESFLRGRKPVRWIMGPIGSGKTNACFFDALTVASAMPVCVDKVRRFKGFVFRDTYTKLWDTVIPSWWQWFPESIGKWTGSKGRQASHLLRFEQENGVVLEFQMDFRALDEHADIEDALKGLEGSWAYLNEGDTLNEAVLTNILGRVLQRRYPPQRLLPASAFTVDSNNERVPNYFSGVIGDMNPPDVDNYTYNLFEELKPDGYQIYKQPSGRSPRGENRAGVSRQSYEDLAKLNAHRPDYVRRMIDGQYGYSRDGLPVYAEYSDERHVAEQDLLPLRGVGLRLGFDQGVLGPAMVVAQYDWRGQLRVIDELVPQARIGSRSFGLQCKQFLLERYASCEIIAATCDPAGFSGGDKEQGVQSWAEIVSEAMGLELMAAPTNELLARLEGVRQLLTHNPGPLDEQGLLLSPRCRVLRKGFNSHYKYELVGVGKNAVPATLPKKNLHSNPHDALQYIVLDIFGVVGLSKGEAAGGRSRHKIGSRRRDDDDDDDVPARGGSDFDVFKV